jgi:hydrogenase expression/formation protein HypC
MCLAVPAKVVEITDGDSAIVDMGGVHMELSLALLEDVEVGDFVIAHVGYALNKIDPEEAKKTLQLFAQMEDSAGSSAG